jgi:hypothetical protein
MAIVDEHAVTSRDPSEKGTPSETNISKLVDEMLERSKTGTREMRSEWGGNYRFFNGQQWAISRPVWRFSEVINICWATVMQEVGIQTDSRPKTDFIATEPTDLEFAEILSELNDINWTKYNWNEQLAAKILDSKIVHVTHTEVTWNPDLEGGIGDIEHKDLDPTYSYWDTEAKSDPNEGRWFIQIVPTPIAELKRKHPEKAEEIKPDMKYPLGMSADGRISVDTDRIKLGYGSNLTFRARASDNPQNEPMGLLIRCWMKDETVEDFAQEKDMGGEIQTEYIQKLKYPGGRYVEKVGNTVLRDGPNGIWINGKCEPWEHGKFPIVRMVNYSYPREYAGETEITHMRSPQRVVNYVWSFILDVMKRGSAPQKIIGSSSGIDVENLTDEPGLNIEVADVNQVRFEYGPGVPASLFNVLSQALQMMDKVQGIQEVSRGAEQPGMTSGTMMEGFVEAAQTRPRLKNRSVEAYLQKLGQFDAATYLQFYKQPRVFRMLNKEGMPQYVQFYISQDEAGNRVANVAKQVQGNDGQFYPGPQQSFAAKGLPDVKVTTGSALPFAKAQKTQTAQMLFQAGAIDQEEFLKAVDWPNAEEVLQRMKMGQNNMQPPGAPPTGSPNPQPKGM